MAYNLDLFADQPARPPPTLPASHPSAPPAVTPDAEADLTAALPMPQPGVSVAEALAADAAARSTARAPRPRAPSRQAAPPAVLPATELTAPRVISAPPEPVGSPADDRETDPSRPPRTAPEDPALDAAILRVTEELAHTQARNPNEKDWSGFRNADFRIGFMLAATRDVEGCAQLLLLYQRQAKEAGLDIDALRRYLPPAPVDPDAPDEATVPMAQHARQQLQQRRERVGGKVGWVDDGDSLVCVGQARRMDVQTRQTLQRVGTRTPTGWRVAKSHLEQLLTGIAPGTWSDATGLRATLQAATEAGITQVPPAPPTAKERRAAAKASTPVLRAKPRANGQTLHLNWTGWKTAAGAAVKDRLKAFGAKFDGETSTWVLPAARMGGALQLMQDLEDVDAGALTPFDAPLSPEDTQLVEDVLAGVTRVRVQPSDTPGKVRLSVPSFHTGYVDATRQAGGRYLREHNATEVHAADLRRFLGALGDDQSLETRAVVEAYVAHLEARQRAIATRTQATEIPTTTPTGGTLMPHQPEGIAHLVAPSIEPGCKGKLLAHEPGLGKTMQVLMAANIVAPAESGKKTVIVCPAIARDTWANEITKWLGPDETMNIVKGTSHRWNPDARFHIVPMSVVHHYTEQIKAMPVGVAALDESHYLKNEGALRTKAVLGETPRKGKERTVGCIEHAEHIWGVSGTPMPNRSIELFPLLRASGHPLGQNFFQYGMRYADGHNRGFGYTFNGRTNMEELGQRLQGFVHVKKKADIPGLPEKMRQEIPVDLDARALKAYHASMRALLSQYAKGQGGEVLTALNAAKLATAHAKVEATVELAASLLETGQKVGIFRQYTEVLDAIQANLPHRTVRIDGATQTDERAGLVHQFQTDPETMVFLGTNAAGMNVTLTAARDAIINDFPWNEGTLLQQEDRFHRIGAKGTVTIRRMVANETFDDQLLEILAEKETGWTLLQQGATSTTISATPTTTGEADTGTIQRLLSRLSTQYGIALPAKPQAPADPTTGMAAALATVHDGTTRTDDEPHHTSPPSLPGAHARRGPVAP